MSSTLILKMNERYVDDQPVRRFLSLSGPARIALLWTVLQGGLLSWLVHRQLNGVGSSNWDLGIFTQATYELARGSSFMSIRGMDILGHHFNVVLFALAPVSWLGGGAESLSIIQVWALVSGTAPAYLLGRDRIAPTLALHGPPGSAKTQARWGLFASGIYLLHPAVTGLSWWMFHPETLALAAVLWAWWFALHKQWGLYAAAVLWVVLCREDLSLAMVGFGVAVAVVFRRDRRAKAAGAVTVIGCLLFWGVVTQVVMPNRIGTNEPYYVTDFWGHLGSTMPEVIGTALKHPLASTEPLHGSAGAEFVTSLLAPTGALNLLSPITMLPAVPQLVAITLSNDPDSRQIWHHHGALLLPFSILSMIESLRWLRRRAPRLVRVWTPFACLSAVFSFLVMSPTVLGVHGDRWQPSDATGRALQAAVDRVPVNASVAATVTPANLLADRSRVYTWPNPWMKWKRGYEFTELPNPDGVDYLVFKRKELTTTNRDLAAKLTGSNGPFEVLSDAGGVVLARRRTTR